GANLSQNCLTISARYSGRMKTRRMSISQANGCAVGETISLPCWTPNFSMKACRSSGGALLFFLGMDISGLKVTFENAMVAGITLSLLVNHKSCGKPNGF